MKNWVVSIILALFYAPAGFAADVVLALSDRESGSRPLVEAIEMFNSRRNLSLKLIPVTSYNSLAHVKIDPQDRIIGVVVGAHGTPTSIEIKGKGLSGKQFARLLSSRMPWSRTANRFFVHFHSCSLSGVCLTNANFIDQFVPEFNKAAESRGSEVLVMSHDFPVSNSVLGGDDVLEKLKVEAAKETLSTRIAAKPLLGIVRFITYASSANLYKALKKIPRAQSSLRGLAHLAWHPSTNFAFIGAAIANAMSIDGTLTESSLAITFAFLGKSVITKFVAGHAQLTTNNGVEKGHIEDLLTKTVVEVRSANPVAICQRRLDPNFDEDEYLSVRGF